MLYRDRVGVSLSQTRPIPRSPDGDKNIRISILAVLILMLFADFRKKQFLAMASTEQFVSAPSFPSRNLDFQQKSGKFSISQNRHLGRRKTENIIDN